MLVNSSRSRHLHKGALREAMAVIPPMVEVASKTTMAKAVVDLRNVGIRTMETIIAQIGTKITSATITITATTTTIVTTIITIKQVEPVEEAIISRQPHKISRITTSAKPMQKTSGIIRASTRFKMNRCRNQIEVHSANSSMARKVAVPKVEEVESMEKEETPGRQAIQIVVHLETLLEVRKVAMEAANSNTARPHRTIHHSQTISSNMVEASMGISHSNSTSTRKTLVPTNSSSNNSSKTGASVASRPITHRSLSSNSSSNWANKLMLHHLPIHQSFSNSTGKLMAGTSSRHQVVPLDKCQRNSNLSLQMVNSNRFKSKIKPLQLPMISKQQIMVHQLHQKVENLVELKVKLVDNKRKSINNQLPKTEKQTAVQETRNKHLTPSNRNLVNSTTITPKKQVMLSCPTTTSLSCTEAEPQ